ncbi:glycosyltransferase family 2 protein [Candidatus Gottesmanbacteria bacterium]|nr:glycosyltransferase family 2 protein [Candidatus Gottesmanbacteria bacterium]
MKKQLFSIIIPTLNEEKFLPKLLQSLVEQSNKDFEVIVVDGKSKDKTVEVARRYEKKLPSLRVIASDKASLPYQRNLGAKNAKGEWYVFVDADGIFLPYFVSRCLEYIHTTKTKFFTCWFRADSEEIKDAIIILLNNIVIEGYVLVHKPWSPGALVLVRRNVFLLVNGYNEEKKGFGEDHDFSTRLHNAHVKLDILREVLCVYSLRRHRKQGLFRALGTYVYSGISVLLTNKSPDEIPGFVMGGQLYNEKILKWNEKIAKDISKHWQSIVTLFQ